DGAQRLDEEGEAKKGVQRADGERRDGDDQHALRAEEDAADAYGLTRERRVELVGNRPEERELRILEQHRDADRGDQRPQLVAALTQRRKHRRVYREPEQRAAAERGEDRQQIGGRIREAEELGGEPRDREVGG